MTEKSDVARSMSGYFDYTEFQFEQRQAERFTFTETLILAGDTRVVRAKNLRAVGAYQFGDATRVVRVVVREQYVAELQAVLFQHLYDRSGIAGVYNGTMIPTGRNEPDIIVGKRRYRCDGNFRHV